MHLGEAREVLAEAVTRVQAEGFRVWGWDDGSVMVSDGTHTTWVDPEDPTDRPEGST